MRMRRRHFAMTQCNYAVDTLQTDEQTDRRTAALLLRQTIPLGNYVTPHHLYAEPWRHRDVRQVRRHRHAWRVWSVVNACTFGFDANSQDTWRRAI